MHPYPEDFFDPIRWAQGGIYLLVPYSNRIAHATLQLNGEAVALEAHPDAAPHTLHGNAQAQAWKVLSNDASSAVLVLDSAPSPAWPWRYWARKSWGLPQPACRRARDQDRRTAIHGLQPCPPGLPAPSFYQASNQIKPMSAMSAARLDLEQKVSVTVCGERGSHVAGQGKNQGAAGHQVMQT